MFDRIKFNCLIVRMTSEHNKLQAAPRKKAYRIESRDRKRANKTVVSI